ncbi:putative S-adenosylmethionine-dependent methyltransferase At5g38780 [Senna tora]|uniref:Putative S-adenosylmethionine-dependent methyltransferase At5g38780 n=1 Tax=Senna tora TaxID=362788 RepID=A0A834TJJ7_9FABA|nr:putative S-adenosylmethionine-dependent methyltransferase At5g38780 [Senna tora]
MEVEGILNSAAESYPMNGGDGPHSYTNNSAPQRRLIEASKELIIEAIEEKLEIDSSSCVNGSKAFGIADLGCSVGNNTFIAVHNIIEAVEKKKAKKNDESNSSSLLEFQVFFNDHSNNDFNSLFRSLPYNDSSRSYYAAAVAGSFYGRLFPNSTLHFVNCSFALHWMSKLPKQILDRNSSAWNGNRIHYTSSSNAKVHEAYADEYKNGMKCFLKARAQEIVGGGLMLIVVPAIPTNSNDMSQIPQAFSYGLLESSFSEMVNLGYISEEKVETFNVPHYFPTSKELEAIIKRNGNFSIEIMEILSRKMKFIKSSVEIVVGTMRAAMEELFRQHFGNEVLPHLFQSYTKKVEENLDILDLKFSQHEDLFLILKRKIN